MQINKSQPTIHFLPEQKSLEASITSQSSASWKEIIHTIFAKLQTDVSRGYHRLGDLWKQAQNVRPLKTALTTLFPSHAQPASAVEFLKDDEQIICKKLKNGFTYYLRQNSYPAKNQAYIQLVVKTGFLNEKKEELGIAHLVEHLLQIRTKHYEKGEIDRYFASKGILWGSGDNNASTSYKETEYHIEIPLKDPEVLDKTLHIFSEMAFHAELLDQYVHHEKEIVCDELRAKQSAGKRYYDQFHSFLFHGTPYGKRPVKSTAEVDNVKDCAPQIVRQFYQKWYQPQNMALTVVGDIDPEQIGQTIEKYFSAATKGTSSSPKHHYNLPSASQPKFLCFTDKEVMLSQAELYYPLPPVPVEPKTSVQEIREQLMNELIKHIINRRLGEMLAYADNSFVAAGISMPHILEGNPSFRVAFTAKEGALLTSLKSLLIELKRFKEHGIDPNEFLMAKKAFGNTLDHLTQETGKVTSSTFADICGSHFDQSDSLTHPDTVLEAKTKAINDITLNELNDRIRYLLQHDNCLMGLVQPEKQGLQAVSGTDLKTTIEEVKKVQVSRYEYTTFDKPLLTHLPKPGKIVETVEHPISGITKYTLENGMTVYAKHTTFLNDTISLQGYSLRGKRDTELSDRLSAKFCERFFDSCGLGEFSLTELRKVLNGKTVSFSTNIGNYQTKTKSAAGKKDLETAFQLLHTLFTNPGYSKQAFDSAIAKLKEILQNKNNSPHLAFSEEIQRVNTQDHLEYQPFILEDLDKIDYETCKKIHKDFYANPSDFTFVIVGNYSEIELKKYIEQYFASLPSNGKKRERLTFPAVPFPKGIIHKQVEGGGNLTNSINALTFPASAGDSSLESCLSIVCTKLIKERLIKNLRLKLGISYTPTCVFNDTDIPGIYTSRPPTSTILLTAHPDNVKDLEEATMKELHNFLTFGPTEQEIEDCKTAIYKTLDKEFQTNRGWVEYIQNRTTWKGDIEKTDITQELLKSLTPEMIQEHSKKLYPLDNYTMVSLVPSKTDKQNK